MNHLFLLRVKRTLNINPSKNQEKKIRNLERGEFQPLQKTKGFQKISFPLTKVSTKSIYRKKK